MTIMKVNSSHHRHLPHCLPPISPHLSIPRSLCTWIPLILCPLLFAYIWITSPLPLFSATTLVTTSVMARRN